jgi:hypothetical protein
MTEVTAVTVETDSEEDAQLAVALPQLCDRPDCSAPARWSYSWEWGESGVCCDAHKAEMTQLQRALKRTCQFGALATGPAPIERGERVALKGTIYALEEELAEAKARGLEQHRQLQLLAGQAQMVTVRNREAEAQLAAARASERKQTALADKLAQENGEMADELSRLTLMVEPVLPRVQPTGSTGVVDRESDTQPGT